MIRVGLSPDGTSLLLRFDYDPTLVELTKQLPGRRFVRQLGGWLVPLTRELVKELPSRYPGAAVVVGPEVENKLATLGQQEEVAELLKVSLVPGALPEDMEFPTTQPKNHQRKALSLMVAREFFACFMEMGTGKTWVVLQLIAWLRKRTSLPALIACPASVMSVWEDQAQVHHPGLKVIALTGTMPQRIEKLRSGLLSGVNAFVINYEALWRLEEVLLRIKWSALILDESTRIKSRTTHQAKAAHKLAKVAKRRYLLTGTPMPNSPLELFSQFLFLDPSILGHHFYAFRDRYAVMGGYQGYQVVSWKNTVELMDKLAKHSFRVLKKDCLDLPEKIYNLIRLELVGDQKKAYKELCEDLVTECAGQQVTAAVLVSKLVKLREILAGFIKRDDGVLHHFKDQAKLDALDDIMEDLPNNAKIVIWCLFREEMEMVKRRLVDKYGEILELHGGVALTDRGPLVERFQTEPVKCTGTEHRKFSGPRIFLGQQKAGGLGITLTAASYCVFMTDDYSPETRLQAEDRLHRIGQRNQVVYYNLHCKGTLDVAVWGALRKKQKLSDLLTGDTLQQTITGVEL